MPFQPVAFRRLSSRSGILAAAVAALLAGTGLPAAARTSVNVSAPFEVGPSPAGNYLAALVAGADHDTLAAATFFREALRYDPRNVELIERTFVAALSNGNINESFRLAERLVAREPHNGLAHLVLGVRSIAHHRWSEARRHFSNGSAGSDITATLLTAWSYAGAGDTKKAIATLNGLKDPRFQVFRDYHAGLILDLAGDVKGARQHLEAAYDANKNTLRLVDAWARFQARHGDVDGAKKTYEAFDKLLPRHPLVQEALAQLNAGKPLEPVVANAEQGAGEVLYGLGAAGGSETDDLASLIYLRLSLRLAPHNGLAVVTLADLYERMKQNERAIDVYQSLPENSALRSNAEIQIALILDSMGKTDEALQHMQAIVQRHPDDVDALTNLANLQRTHKDFKDAAENYTKVLKLSDPLAKTNWPILYFRGICYERTNKFPDAVADFKAALALFPDQPLVLNYLGYSWIDRGEHLDEAFDMLRKAVDERPTDGYIVDSLGWAYYKLGKYKDAQRELERAVDLKPSDPTINDHLGDVYWRLGRHLEAHFQWNHARDMKPDPDELKKIQQKIEHGLDDGPTPATAGGTETPPPPQPAPAKPQGDHT